MNFSDGEWRARIDRWNGQTGVGFLAMIVTCLVESPERAPSGQKFCHGETRIVRIVFTNPVCGFRIARMTGHSSIGPPTKIGYLIRWAGIDRGSEIIHLLIGLGRRSRLSQSLTRVQLVSTADYARFRPLPSVVA